MGNPRRTRVILVAGRILDDQAGTWSWVLFELHALKLCLVSSVTFPFIRSSRIEFNFSVSVRSGQRHGATERQCGHDYVNGLRKRIRINGNVMLETRH